jgi:triosephosphate isomerase
VSGTPTRRPLISGNWKMNLDHLQALHAVRDLGLRLRPGDLDGVDASVHPPFTDLRTVQSVLESEGIPLALGAQSCAVEDAGAFTGEVSALMLAKLHVTLVIVGHSERRQYFGETDTVVAAKLRAVVRNGMVPICCVGETGDERDSGLAKDRLAKQVEAALGGVHADTVAELVLAYEPIWAIGSGQAATPEDAQDSCRWIREVVAEVSGPDAAARVRILYGGSVNADNAASLVSCPDVDGLLVGGASLDPEAFLAIIRAASQLTQ